MNRRWVPPTPASLVSACWATGITLATASYLAVLYPTLPAGLPVRFLEGEPVFYQLKTPMLVMLPALVQVALFVTFGCLALLLLWRARPETADAAARADSERMRYAVQGVAFLGALWITVQAFGAARIVALWQSGTGGGGFGRVYSVIMLVALAMSSVIVWRTMKSVRTEAPEPVVATDPSMWPMKNLYVNRHDPALFVPTRRGAGWTVNFGRPVAIFLIAGVVLIGVGGPFWIARTLLQDGAFIVLRIRR